VSWLALRRRVEPLDALAALAAAPVARGDRFYLERPEACEARVGLGAAARVTASGAARFRVADCRSAALLARLEVAGDPGPAASGPQVLGGFAFADAPGCGAWAGFDTASLVLPELLLVRRGNACWLTAIGPHSGSRESTLAGLDARLACWQREVRRWGLHRESGPPAGPALEHRIHPDEAPGAFATRVKRALEDVACGELEKVVVARAVTLSRDGGYRPIELLRALRGSLPSCASYLVRRGDAVLFGATPERLLRRRGRLVTTAAVAGTAPRGRSPERDRRLGRDLLESKKEQAEHAVVLRFLLERLGRRAHAVRAREAPQLLKLDGLQHLCSPVAAELARSVGVLELAGDLHPTPATGGAPEPAARQWLARHERLDRGWYAGPLGWRDSDGDGDLWVALRAGLARDDALHLFAGAGIVAGSDPADELRETRLKLGTLLQPALEI